MSLEDLGSTNGTYVAQCLRSCSQGQSSGAGQTGKRSMTASYCAWASLSARRE
jgi:hypothetical protein